MKKITILLSLVATVVLFAACDAKKSNPVSEEKTSEKREAGGIAQRVVDDALSRVRDADADVEDVPPMIDEPYKDENLNVWIFSEDEGKLVASYYRTTEDAEPTRCRLSKRGPASYDAYPGERAVTMCVLRVKEGGEIIEMAEGSTTTIFKNSDRYTRDVKAKYEEDLEASEEE